MENEYFRDPASQWKGKCFDCGLLMVHEFGIISSEKEYQYRYCFKCKELTETITEKVRLIDER